MKTPEQILELNFYRPQETLKHYDNIITCMEDYAEQFKNFGNNSKHNLGTMDAKCEHEIEKLYNKNGDYKADYCIKCKGIY